MNILQAENIKHIRGKVLRLVYENQQMRNSRLTQTTLWSILDRLHFDVGENDVEAVLEDLKARDYLTYEVFRDRKTNERKFQKIEIRPKGCDAVEGTIKDEAVLFD